MLYLIGLGLNTKGMSLEGLEAIKKCSRVYLEGYTVDFPYETRELEEIIGKNVEVLARESVESDFLIMKAKKEDIALLIYGCPLFATTHQTLVEDSRKEKVKVKVIYASSIFDAIAETGLQLYKFGKITSMPAWKKNFTPDSFLDVVKENLSINAHSLILVDIGLEIKEGLIQLGEAMKKKEMKIEKILLCSNMGTEDKKVYYNNITNLKNKKVNLPYCFIIPSELHFMEEASLNKF